MRNFLLLFSCCFWLVNTYAQSNYQFTNPAIESILKGNYNSTLYNNALKPSPKNEIIDNIFNGVNQDSLLNYLMQLSSFTTRNTGSDTVSNTLGIGAARRWAHAKFERFSAQNNKRLLASYFQFDKLICSSNQHRNIMAILPGSDTSYKGFVLIEAHLDSRCESVCDTLCLAQGMEDNGSGCALLLELARVMSSKNYRRTIVFMLTIGEEQGLDGADAFAKYCKSNNLNIKAVFNNDVIGGIICGKTSSPPGCPSENERDSINVRIYSAGTNLSSYKGLARFVKLEFEEEMKPKMSIKTIVNLMNAEDRTGRGGDHIPFRQQNYNSIRFTSANEHGDANPVAGYADRQHSTRDILGKDFNNDNVIDSYYVSTSYLQRNCLLNGTSIAMAANGPNVPEFSITNVGNGITIVFKNPISPNNYRVGIRTRKIDFDTVYKVNGQSDFTLFNVKTDSIYYVSVARFDDENIESLFATEQLVKVKGAPNSGITHLTLTEKRIHFIPVSPNPADETLSFAVWVKNPVKNAKGLIEIRDTQGKLVSSLPIALDAEVNEVLYEHGYNAKGLYHCALFIEGEIVDTQKLIFK
ncbi:MAG: M28 family peptidase [Bacteroidetes bacterium]|nr:M28 family peptidase [Bacteroidota bacterium]